jgi:hypothetical protein
VAEKAISEQRIRVDVGADIRLHGMRVNQEQETMMMSTTRRNSTGNDAALAAFITRKAEIDAMLERLAAFSNGHFELAPEDVHWGHVANLGHVIERLRQATDFLFQEGECAG